jgi:predicted amidohydrolase
VNVLEIIKYGSLSAIMNRVLSLTGFIIHKLVMVSSKKIVINDLGQIVSIYRKVHLFDIDIPNGPCIKESQGTVPGEQIMPPIDTPAGKLGLCICYDLRFPEQSALLRRSGAELISYPSAFTIKTGIAHWEVLLKARAIETQTFVIAAAQVGIHNSKRSSYGHSLVIDPWGNILAACKEEENHIVNTEIDLELLSNTRRQMPIEDHKRYRVYNKVASD